MRSTRRWSAGRLAAVLLVVALAGSACSSRTATGAPTPSPSVSPLGTVTVQAASSLTETFTALAKAFEAAHPGSKVVLNFGASSALARQIKEGAPADVFAAASPTTMEVVTSAGAADGTPQVFAKNRLEIAVPPANPGKVTGLADFARPELRIAVCAPQVPCGTAADRVFTEAGVTPKPDTLEQDVKAALAKVSSGEVDAALVYRTDVLAAGKRVRGIDFPESVQAVNDYPIVALRHAPNPAGATAFRDFILSEQTRAVLVAAGFEEP